MAGINGTKDMASEKVLLKAFANNHDEIVTFDVHPTMCFGNRRYDYSQIEQKYKHLKLLPNEIVDLHDVKVVVGQD